LKQDATASFILDLLGRLRHCACIYEIGDDAPTNDGMPFVLALFSWSVRMLSYSEPSLFQKTRAVYWSLVVAQRILWDIGDEVGPTAVGWIEQYRQVWEGQKGRRLSASATQVQVVTYQFEVEFPRYLAQVGTSEAWSTDFLTREKVHVTENCVVCDVKFSGRIYPKLITLAQETRSLISKLQHIHQLYVPVIFALDHYFGRFFLIGDSGSGKTMLTKQLFSEVSQHQLLDSCGEKSGIAVEAKGTWEGASLIPVRVPLIDFGRQLEAEPDTSLAADPVNDLLTQWLQRKYGQDSAPHKLVSDIRNACLGAAHRRSSIRSEDMDGSATGLPRRASIGSADIGGAGEGSPDRIPADGPQGTSRTSVSSELYATSEMSALFLLLDGLDEASSAKSAVFAYLMSFLENEPMHLLTMTSRPGTAGTVDLHILSQFGFHAFLMAPLTDGQSETVVQRVLKRMMQPEEMISMICTGIQDNDYSVIKSNPLMLTLLIHVLRKSYQLAQGGVTAGSSHQHTEAMKKTEIYQRAVKLMIHQSDAAKFMLRDGQSDKAMVQRLEMLKSPRARKLFQTMSWHAHSQKARGMTWSNLEPICADTAMLAVLREAFDQGRMPIFEKVESLSSEPMFQFAHLSFQELMVGEYSSAIVQHSHANQKARAYINFFLSNSTRTLERERLSELWWLQAWLHVCEMLHSSAFEEWCSILAEDKRSELKIGSLAYKQRFDFSTCSTGELLRPYWPKCITKENDPHRPYRLYRIYPYSVFQVFQINWERGVVRMRHRREYPGEASWCAFLPRDAHKFLWSCMDVLWPLQGVASLHREAMKLSNLQLAAGLLKHKVHFGIFAPFLSNDEWVSFVGLAVSRMQWPVVRLCTALKGDYTQEWDTQFNVYTFLGRVHRSPACWDEFNLSESLDQLMMMQPYGVLEQAQSGALELLPEVDPNFSDPASGLTPLMCATAEGHVELVRTLIAGRADVHKESTEGATAITFTSSCASGLECLRLLIAARADVNQRSGKTYHGRWYLDYFGRNMPLGFEYCLRGETKKLDLANEAGYNTELRNDFNISPVWGAVIAGRASLVRTLGDLMPRKGRFMERIRHGKVHCWPLTLQLLGGAEPHLCHMLQMFAFDCEIYKICLGEVEDADLYFNRVFAPIKSKLENVHDIAALAILCDPAARIGLDFESSTILLDRKYDINYTAPGNRNNFTEQWLPIWIGPAPMFWLFLDAKADLTTKHFLRRKKIFSLPWVDSHIDDWIKMRDAEASSD